MTNYKLSIFIFRRDLRLYDNTGLIESLKQSNRVIPIFIFTPEQLINNPYKSDNAVQFMIESLEDLNDNLNKKGSRLYYFFGKPHIRLKKILNTKLGKQVEAIFVNMDYTPYSIKRDKSIERLCNEYNIDFHSYEDVLLNPVESILTGKGTVYQKFTPYFNVAKKVKVRQSVSNNYKNYLNKRNKITGEFKGDIHKFYTHNDNIAVNGGRKNGMIKYRKIKNHKQYNKNRNTLSLETTRLSAYLKFGCLSIREVYEEMKSKLGMRSDLIKQLYWRDFYYNVGYAFPHIFKKGKNLKPQYDNIKWYNNNSYFNKWKKGITGFPLVDAGMKELNETGFMHNRTRLITSNFLIKVLGIDWRKGEKYYAKQLCDYCPIINNTNWGWSASSGVDSQP
jgi:deoxyribodipyrimidine photo-lyase